MLGAFLFGGESLASTPSPLTSSPSFTQLYLTNTAAPYTPATLRGAWDDTAGAVTKALDTSKVGGGALTTVSRAETNASTTYDVLLYRGVSGPLAAQTFSGTLDVVLGIVESASDADFYWHLHVYVTQGDSDTPRGTLLSDYIENTTNEWVTTAAGKGLQSAQTLSALAISVGDRLVAEIGYIARNSLTASRTGTLNYGTLDATTRAEAPDLAAASTAVTTSAGFLVFSAAVEGAVLTTRVSQLAVEVQSQPIPLARVSQFPIEVAADAGIAPARVSQFVVEIVESPVVQARVSALAVEIVAQNKTPFENAIVQIGLTWMIVTLRDGTTQYVWADRPLPDPSTYYLGWKEPRVLTWGRIRRALSSVLDGQYETADFSVVLDDNDHFLRDLDDALLNATVAVYMITDEGRRALEVPTTVYRGVIRDAKPTGVLQYELKIKDPFAEAFSTSATTNLVPRRTVIRDDFANCGQIKVNSSAEGYVVDGAVSSGGSPDVTRIPVRDGWGCFASGDELAIDGHVFHVTNSSTAQPAAPGGDVETWIEVDPAVGGTLGDGAVITQSPTHTVDASQGKRVLFPYGYITDRHFTAGEDEGDGQGLPLYVGEKVLADGRTYAEFLWAGWACYGGPEADGKPFRMVYFWNNPLPWGFYFPDVNSLPEEADVDGRICCPGYGNWVANGFTDSFVDYNGRRYTVLYLRGVFRDWALGITAAPLNLGGVPFAVNAYGAEDVGDGSGALIANLAQQYEHAVLNLCPPKGEGYQSGPWLASPTFPDDPSLPMIDHDSFNRADAQSAVYVTDGFRGDFIVGAKDEAISARALIARFNLSGAWQCGFNNKTQFFIDLVNTDLATVSFAAALGWVRDIFTQTFTITPATKDLYTAIRYVHTQDYCGRTDWRSKLANVANALEVESAGATASFGSKTTYETLSLYMLRGKNVDHDADDYYHGSATIEAVLALTLARLCAVQHLPALQTGPAGFEYELADTLPITHFEGYGVGGWVDEPVRIERTEIDPNAWVEIIEGYQLASMLGVSFDWPRTWTPADPEADPPVTIGPPDPPEEW